MGVAMHSETQFAERLRALRAAAGLTLAGLAGAAGMHLQAVAKLERGEREPQWSTVLRLARALSVPVTAFLADGEAPPADGEQSRRRGRPAKAPTEPAPPASRPRKKK